MSNDGPPWAACDKGMGKPEGTSLSACRWPKSSPALYSVSTPSGIMTIRAVPTNTPMPMVEINRSRDCERGKESGNEPARNELPQLVFLNERKY